MTNGPVERERFASGVLCAPDGRLDPGAVGWSRHPLLRCNLRGRFPRKKRWDYWCVTDGTIFLGLVVADIDYLGLAAVSFIDFRTGERFERVKLSPLGAGVRLAESVGGAPLRFERSGLRIAVEPSRGGTRIAVSARTRARSLSAEIAVAPPDESVNVVVPWDESRFQFTSKQIGMPATGRIEFGRAIALGDAFACLDFGRGVWPHKTAWCWAAAAGRLDGRRIAFNLGGRWTDGTGATENGLIVDGVVTKIGERVTFTPGARAWRIEAPSIRLEFTPIHSRRLGWARGPLHARLDWRAGTFSGVILDRRIDSLFGWAEEMVARW